MAEIVRLVALQFMVSEKYLRATPEILQGVRETEPEPRDAREVRKVRDYTHQANNMVVDPTERVTANTLVYDLLDEGYIPVDAKRQTRLNDRGGWDHVFRFTLAKAEFVVPSEGLEERGGQLLAALLVLCEGNMWRAQAFRNPFYKDGTEVPDQVSIDVNLKARETLVDENGPVLVWQKDEAGKRTGMKVQLDPSFTLAFLEGNVRLLSF